MAKISKLPLLLSAATFLLFSVCVVQAQLKVEISVPHFKRQHEDGSLDITVSCSLTNTGKHFLGYGPCKILSYVPGRLPDDLVELASYGGWAPQNSLKECVHTLKLKHEQQMASGAANRVGSGDGVRSNEQLYCQRDFLLETCTGYYRFRKCEPTKKWASSPYLQESTSELLRRYKRSARIISRRIGASELNGDALNVPYNGKVTLECEVQNLSYLPENRCRWQFVNNQNDASFFHAGEDTVDPAVGSHQKAVVRKHSERWNRCLLELTDVDETMEGRWSCNPSEGQKGFISPSNPVLIKVVDMRAAKINIGSSTTALDIPYNGNVTLECEVQNMKELPEDRCRWQFMNDQNTLHSYGGGQDKHVDTAASFPRNMAVVRRHTQRPNVCLLELTGVDETMESRWSCNPSEGSADGFISPSTPVLIKVVGGCKSHSDCPENQQLCLNATDEVSRRICGNPCDLEEGKKICGNLTNALCKVDEKAAVGMVCACQKGYGSDTGYPDNRTRCLLQCPNKNQDCFAVEGVCTPVKQNTPGRCFPVCEVTKPQCGPGASCQKMPPINTNAPWTSKCECDEGKYKNVSLHNTSFECELPIFNGLHINIKIDGREQPETCSISHANGSEKCQTSVTDGSLLQVTCEAPRVFPAATLELWLTMNSSDEDSFPIKPPPGQQSPKIASEHLHNQVDTRYHGQLPAINVTIADHDNATFVCKLTTLGSSNVTVIEMKLNVTRLPVAPVTDNLLGTSVSTVAGSAAASVIAVIVLGAIVIIAIKHRQRQHQQKQGSNSNDSMALSQISNTRPARSLPPPSSYSVTVNATTKGTHRSNTQQPQNSHQTILSGQPTNTSPKPSTARPVPSSGVTAEAHLPPASIGKTDPIHQVAETQDDLIYADLDLVVNRSDAAAAKPLHKTHKQLEQKMCEEETIYAAIVGEIVQDDLQRGED